MRAHNNESTRREVRQSKREPLGELLSESGEASVDESGGIAMVECMPNFLFYLLSMQQSCEGLKFPAQGIYQAIFSRKKNFQRETRMNTGVREPSTEFTRNLQGMR
jgi:hypothetical protein